MEVKPGYKQTEVGVLPEDWEIAKIGELIENRSILGHLDGNHGELYPRSHEFKTHGVPYVGAQDFDAGKVTFSRCKFLSVERAAKFRKGVAEDGDVLFAHNATVGPVALLRTTAPFVILSTTATYFRCDPSRLNNGYLKGALQSEYFVRQYRSVMAQSTRFQVPITAQRRLSLALPPLREQEAIAEALSDADALIESLEKLIEKKRAIKQGAMQELLTGKRRLPGFTGKWEEKRLGEVALLKARIGWQGLTTGEYLETGDFFLVTGTDIVNGHVNWQACHFVTEARYQQDKYIQLRENDVLVTKDGTIGKIAIVKGMKKPATLNSGVFVIRPAEASFDPEFFYYLLSSAVFLEFLTKLSAGSTINHLYQKDFINFTYRCPHAVSEQSAIAQALSGIDADIARSEGKLSKLRKLKQGMMQELLTGRVRLV